jgi:DNA primase
VGLVARRKNSPGHYDRFKGRVLFPIFDTQARAVGIGGRVLPGLAAEDAAKYVNSPETPLFSKSHLLYGLNVARDAIRKTGTAVVMEGYTDCIVAHQCGFDNAVAVLGTALGAGHIQLLRRFADRVRVVLVLDGDEAGRKRAKEVLELFVAANVDLRVLTLPDELDPADFLLDHGREALEQLVESAPDALSHAFRTATAGVDLKGDLHAATQALEQLTATIAKAPRLRSDTQVEDRLREEKFLQRLAGDFRVPEEQVRELVTQLRRKTAQRDTARGADASVRAKEKIEPLERELLEVLLQAPSAIERVTSIIQPAQLVSGVCRFVLTRCNELWAAGILPDYDRLLLEIDDPGVKNLLVELDEVGRRKGATELEVRLHDVLSALEHRQREQTMRGRASALKDQQLTQEDALAALVDLVEHERAKQHAKEERARLGSSDPTEG